MKSLELYKSGKVQKVSNVLEAIQKGTQLSIVKKELGRMKLIALVSNFIIEFQDNLNIENKMSSEQIPFCAEEIINIYWGYKVEEIKLFFQKASIGKYGKIYNRLDCMVIFEMLEKYDMERDQELLRNHEKKKSQKTTINSNEVPDKIKDKITELEKKSSFDYKDQDYQDFKNKVYKENLKG